MIGVKYEYVGLNAAVQAFPTICKKMKEVEYSYEKCFAKNEFIGSTPDGICFDRDDKKMICVVEVKCMKWHDYIEPPSSFPNTRSKCADIKDRCRKTLAQVHMHMFCCDCNYAIISFVTKKHGCSCFLLSFDRDYFNRIVTRQNVLVAPSVKLYNGVVNKVKIEENISLRTRESRRTIRGTVDRATRLSSRHLT